MLSTALSLIVGLVVTVGCDLCGIPSPVSPAIDLLDEIGLLAGERGADLAVSYVSSQPHQAEPVQAPEYLSDNRTTQTSGG